MTDGLTEIRRAIAEGQELLGERLPPGPDLAESAQSTAAAAGQPPPEITLPAAFTVFPGEIFQAPRSWVVCAGREQVSLEPHRAA